MCSWYDLGEELPTTKVIRECLASQNGRERDGSNKALAGSGLGGGAEIEGKVAEI